MVLLIYDTKWYQMTGFEITELSGHMAAMGHTWALENVQDQKDTDGALVHGICIHMLGTHFISGPVQVLILRY